MPQCGSVAITMGERKAQDDFEAIFCAEDRDHLLSDDGYIALGSMLNRGDVSTQYTGSREVIGLPAMRAPRETLAISDSIMGRLPRSLMHALGLERVLLPIIMRNLIPRCGSCNVKATRPVDLASVSVPKEGFVALVIRDGDQEIGLEERCELLGVERAYVDGMLVRREEIGGRSGEPVLRLFSAGRLGEEGGVVNEWFACGGGPLVVVHLVGRESKGVEQCVLSGSWRCLTCNQAIRAPAVSDLYAGVPCERCKGEGWLLVERGRLVACEGCDGFGSSTAVADAQFGPVIFRYGAVLTVEDLLGGEFNISPEESQSLHIVKAAGFGRYPLGTPLALFSQAEQALLATVSIRLSAIVGILCVVDAPAVGLFGGALGREAWTSKERTEVVFYEPRGHAAERKLVRSPARDLIELREISIGAFAVERLSFPKGAASLVQGVTGGGGLALLFDEIEYRFSHRRKLSHSCNFGDINRVIRVDCFANECKSVLALLGLERSLAEEVSRSQLARQLGFLVDDLDLAHSRHRCRECLSSQERAISNACPHCRGALLDWRVAALPVGKSATLDEVMRGSLDFARKALWAHDLIDAVLAGIPSHLRARLSLATNPRELAPAERRFLMGSAALSRVTVMTSTRALKRGSLLRAMVLLEGVFANTSMYQSVLLDQIDGALKAGSTVLCSGAPQALESCFASVLRLAETQVKPTERFQNRFMDRRLSRWVQFV